MTVLIIGILLWVATHLFKRLMPDQRAALAAKLGEGKARGSIAGALLVSVVLMVIGYRAAEFSPVYSPLPGMGHLNNLLMLGAVMLMGMGSSRGRLRSLLRHPMLTGVIVWAVAHLLVNGDVASVVLFGAMAVWAVAEMLVINATSDGWNRPEPGPASGDVRLVVISVFILAVIAGIHTILGHSPFLGTYG